MTCRTQTAPAGPTVVTVAGEVDLAEAGDLQAALREPVEQGRDVVVDMRQVGFIDCTGLHALIQAASLAARRGCRLVIQPSPAVRRLVRLAEPRGLRGM